MSRKKEEACRLSRQGGGEREEGKILASCSESLCLHQPLTWPAYRREDVICPLRRGGGKDQCSQKSGSTSGKKNYAIAPPQPIEKQKTIVCAEKGGGARRKSRQELAKRLLVRLGEEVDPKRMSLFRRTEKKRLGVDTWKGPDARGGRPPTWLKMSRSGQERRGQRERKGDALRYEIVRGRALP